MSPKFPLPLRCAFGALAFCFPLPVSGGIVSVDETGRGGDAAAIIETGFGEDSLTFSDRTHEHNGAAFNGTTLSTSGGTVVPLPDYLVGNDYVRFANNARDNGSYSATVTADQAVTWYLLIDNRVDGAAGNNNSPNSTDPVLGGGLQWVLDGGWQRVNTGISPGGQADYTGVDESGNGVGAGQGLNQFYSVYTLPAPSASVVVSNNGHGGNNMISLVAGTGGGGGGDDDTLPDAWEIEHFGDLDQDDDGDFDLDGLTNVQEFNLGTDPDDKDSDNDGLEDGEEFNLHETDPTKVDTDRDGLNDGVEVAGVTDPTDADSDDDGLNDGQELAASTDPNDPDSDDDGFNDAVEVSAGSNPNDGGSVPQFSNLDDVVVNEFMASNDAALLDEDGDSSDWIEIWNPTSTAVDLTGWALSDDAAEPGKWLFPAQTLAPNQFLVVFASGKDRAVPGGQLHTDFQLDKANGSSLSLSRPDGGGFVRVSGFAAYGSQFEDVSFGLYGDTPPLPSGYFQNPTPGAANDGAAVAGFVDDTRFDVDRGIYDEAFTLTIASDTPGASIIYTTDGTVPSESPANGTVVAAADGSTPPAASVAIATTTVVRAMAVKEGFEPTDVDTHSYLFPAHVLQQGIPAGRFRDWGHTDPDWEVDPDVVNHANPESRFVADDLKDIPTISLGVPPADFWGSRGIYISGEGVPVVCSVEYINPEASIADPNGRKGFQIDGTVQIAGGSSTGRWKSDKLSMRLKFTSALDGDLRANVFDYPGVPFGDEATDRFDTLILDARLNQAWTHPSSANGGQGTMGQYVRDQFMADTQNALGGTAPHGRHVHLYIAGIYWGMHTLHERPDDNFAAQYLGGDNDDYDAIKHRVGTVLNGSNASFRELNTRLSRDLSVPANHAAVEEMFDLEDFAKYMLTNYWAGNTDWSHQNWYASYNKVDPDGKWRFHSWDAEHVLKGVSDDATGRNDSSSPTGWQQLLMRTRGGSLEYRVMFGDLVRREFFNGGVFDPVVAEARYMDRINMVQRAIRGESARWGDNRRSRDPYTKADEWQRELNRLRTSYFPQRTARVLSRLRSRRWYPATDPVDFNQHGGAVDAGFGLTMSSPDAGAGAGTIYYTVDGSDPRLGGGGLNGNAVAYSGTVTLNGSALIQARVRDGSEWSALTGAEFLVGTVPAGPDNLVVSEISYRPAGPSDAELAAGHNDRSDFEFIELMNVGAAPIDLTGVVFSAGIDFSFDEHSVTRELGAGERLVIVEDEAAFRARYGDAAVVAGIFQNGTQLSNGGERVTMENTSQVPSALLSFRYDDDVPWPTAADGDGFTLTLAGPQPGIDLDDGRNWRASVGKHGSPGGDDGTTFASWAVAAGIAGSPELGDDEADGIENFVEYGMGLPPLVDSSAMLPAGSVRALPVLGATADYFTVSFQRNKAADDVVAEVQVSGDLAGDTWNTLREIVSIEDNGDGTEQVTVRADSPLSGATTLFVRVVFRRN